MILNAGKSKYELIPGWAKCPEGWSPVGTGGLSAYSRGNVYVFTRGEHPVMIFDPDGNLMHSWDERI